MGQGNLGSLEPIFVYLHYKLICDCVCLFPRISVGFACMGLIFCKCARGPISVVCTLNKFLNSQCSPGGGDITKKPMWTFRLRNTEQ